LLEQYQVNLVEEDAFYDLYGGVRQAQPIKSFHTGSNMVYCSSFTNILAPGYQIGWCLPGRFKQALLGEIDSLKLPNGPLQQMVLAEFMRSVGYAAHTSNLLRIFALHHNKLERIVARHFPSGSQLRWPEGGFTYWINLPHAIDAERFHQLTQAIGITVAVVAGMTAICSALRLSVGRLWIRPVPSK
jgi:DNA-binding transcriptional MocR family regulator